MLEVTDVHTYYGASHILQGVSLTVPEAAVVAVLGRNGVGKTTLMRSIIGFTPPGRGRITFRGAMLTGLPPERIVRAGIAIVPQGRRIFPSLTVLEQLRIARRDGTGRAWTIERILDLFPALRNRLHHPGTRLSGGEQQMLAIARSLLTNPALLLLDEPTEGLAPLLVDEVGRVIERLRAERLSVLLVEQNLTFALELADHAYVMSKGRIVVEGRPQDVWADEDTRRRYLGV